MTCPTASSSSRLYAQAAAGLPIPRIKKFRFRQILPYYQHKAPACLRRGLMLQQDFPTGNLIIYIPDFFR